MHVSVLVFACIFGGDVGVELLDHTDSRAVRGRWKGVAAIPSISWMTNHSHGNPW